MPSDQRSAAAGARPRVVLLADRPGWAFDQVAQALRARLARRFELRVVHREVEPVALEPDAVDLLYVFFWGDTSYQHLGLPPERIVKEVASWRWQREARYGRLDARAFAERHLADCAAVTTPSRRLYETLAAVHPNVFHCPNGVELARFRPAPRRGNALRIAWSGNPADACKGLHDVLMPACAGRFALEATDGARTHDEVARLYARSDVIAVASEAESQPLPLLEAMAAGCFPVTTDVGIVPELVVSGVNGLVVERTPEAFRSAFAWCESHLAAVRAAGRLNARLVAQERHWDALALRFGALFDHRIGGSAAPPRTPEPVVGPARAALDRGAVPLRVAFVTPELAGGRSRGGGLGRYVRRSADALVAAGHAVEVFTTDADADEEGDVALHRVAPAIGRRWVRALLRALHTLGIHRAAQPLLAGVDAFFLARALARRERAAPFDAVQSADYRASGLFVPGRARTGRAHLVRASNDEAELARLNGDDVSRRAWLDALQRHCLRRADAAYAPSAFLARHYAERHDLALAVLRPPLPIAPALAPLPAELELPKRYLVHFGQLGPAKGSDVLAAALPAAWRRAPDLEMVWIGSDRQQRLPGWRALWGARRGQVHWLGPLPHETLRAVVAAADAAVLVPRFDNLPNTAIECLELGVPLVASDGASLDELVEPGRDGVRVPPGDPAALAEALVEVWRAGPRPRRPRAAPPPGMVPAEAIAGLLALAGLGRAQTDGVASVSPTRPTA